jgi:RNA polymerase sigma-70 factor (ECF subfamily)
VDLSKPEPMGVAETTRSLLVGLKGQENAAWNRLVKLYTPLVYHWCQKQNLKTDDIPDVIQEVFKSVSEHIDRFRKDRPKDTFRGWLRVITRNKAMDHFRRAGKQAAHGEGGTEALNRLAEIPAPEAQSETEQGEDAEAKAILFRQALELIKTDFREPTWQAFWRVVVDGRTPTDVADEMGMSAGAVRVAKCRVLQRLRSEMGDLLDE